MGKRGQACNSEKESRLNRSSGIIWKIDLDLQAPRTFCGPVGELAAPKKDEPKRSPKVHQ